MARMSAIEGNSLGWYGILAALGLLILFGLGSALFMEHNGHYVTGMTNQIVWGLPHVFAVFLIVAASGALNVASIASVFGKVAYKPLAPLSALLAIALLMGGLSVLLLDLGHPDRLIVAMTYYNFKSIFAWNIILYNGFLGIVGVYIWMMLDRTMNKYSHAVGLAAFIWRLILTTGTGSIFGFIVARQSYDAAIMAPMFIVMSFAYGLAIYLLVLTAIFKATDRELGNAMLFRLKNLLGVFIAAAAYFVLAFTLTNLYATEHHGYEAFILLGENGGSAYSQMFWIGQVIIGTVLPLIILYHPTVGKRLGAIMTACVLVVLGGLAQMYVTIIGGQAYPLEMFPGKDVSSSFFDGVAVGYSPSMPEFLLGISGIAIALAMVVFAIKILAFTPVSLADES